MLLLPLAPLLCLSIRAILRHVAHSQRYVLQGSCGYGSLDQLQYPYWSVAALSTQNRFYKAGPASGCGECFEIQCINSGGKFAVSASLDVSAGHVFDDA